MTIIIQIYYRGSLLLGIVMLSLWVS